MGKEKDIDGGFAWFILMAAFSVMFLNGVLVYSTGVINTAILEEIDNDLSRTSWIGSTMLATFTLCGPLAGLFTKAFGYRVSCFCGGLLILVGLSAASFVNDVTSLIVTYGIIAGFGLGLGMNSSCVVPGHFFRKRRGLAFGVTASGAAIGMFAGSPLARILLAEYRLRGCLLIFGAISSNMCVAACLLRPIKVKKKQKLEEYDPLMNDFEMTVPKAPDTFSEETVNCKQIDNDYLVDDTEKQIRTYSLDCSEKETITDYITGLDTKNVLTESGHMLLDKHCSGSTTLTADGEVPASPRASPDITEDINRDSSCGHFCCIQLSSKISLNSCSKCRKLTVANKYGFLCYCLSVMFWTMGEGACLFHLPNYAELKGSTKTQSANLFTIMGMTSLMSRLLAGFAGNDSSIGFLLMHIGLVGMAGMWSLLFPLFSNSYVLQLVFSGAYGLYSGGPNSLMSPLTIELVGLKKLPVGLGTAGFFSGIGFLIGAPTASLIYKATNKYDYTFIFAGGLLMLAALFGAMMGMFESHSHPPLKADINVDSEQ